MHIEEPPPFDSKAVLLLGDELSGHPLTQEALARANDDYEYWQKFRRRPLPPTLNPADAWRLLKFYRKIKSVDLGVESLPTLHFVVTDSLLERLHNLDNRLGGTVGFGEEFEGYKRTRYLKSALMEEAIASSQLEGASTERTTAKAMLRRERKPQTASERMIANNYAAMQFVVRTREQPITANYLLELHSIATENTLDDPAWEGAFRIGGNQVINRETQEVVHIAPAVHALPRLIDDICAFAQAHRSRPFVHPLVRAAVLHFLVGYVHPFEDGNGRTARALMYAFMLRQGYWLTEFLVISKAIAQSRVGYDRAYLYTEHDQLDATYFLHHQLKAMQAAIKQFESYLERKIRREREARELMLSDGINPRQVQILAQVRQNPRRVFTVQGHAADLEVTLPTARGDLEDLVNRGRLRRARPGRQVLYSAPTQ